MASEIRVNQIQSRTGVSTISFTETGPIISGVTTITGDLDVTGLVSYEDVTNIDSIGIVTARNGLNVAGGNVGIGSDNPQTKLDLLVGGSSGGVNIHNNATGSAFYQLSTTANSYKVESIGSDLRIYNNTASSESLRITSGGVVGMGTDNPGAKLEVHSDTIPRINTVFQGSKHFGMSVGGSGGGCVLTDGHFMAVNHQPYADRGTDNNLTERLRITSAGDIGIGINAPTTGNIASSAKFIHIHNSATTTHSPAEIYFTNANSGSSGGAGGLITFYNTGFYVWNYANDDLVFGTGGNERFKFNHSTNALDFTSTSKIRLQGSQNSGGTLAHINIGSDGTANSETRAIDIWGNWQDQESKTITYNHGTGTSDMVCQQRVRYDQSPSRSNYEIGRFYHGQNTTAFPFQLQSTSTTTADLTIDGNVLHKTAAFVARSTANNNITSTTRAKIDYTVDYSYQGVFDNTNDRFTCQKAGLYFFYARHWFGSSSTGTVYMDWLRNGSLVKEFRVTHPYANTEYETIQGSGMLYMAVNDYLEVYGRSDGTGVFHESNGGAYSEFSGFYVSGS